MLTSKYCKACAQTKDADAFHKNKRCLDGLNFYCKPCARAKNKTWVDQHPVAARAFSERQKEWRSTERGRAYVERNRAEYRRSDARKAELKRYWDRQIAGLTNVYVATFFRGMKAADIPLNLLELKRQQLLLKRLAGSMQRAADAADNK